MRDNSPFWRTLHEGGYFDKHKVYAAGWALDDVVLIRQFIPLRPDMIVVVIGSGQGRECRALSPLVRRVIGIEVDRSLLLAEPLRDLPNFIGMQSEDFLGQVSLDDIDLVYSVAVMQHLTRDWVHLYMTELGTRRLAHRGSMILQFMERAGGDADARLDTYEPCVTWTEKQIKQLAKDHNLLVRKTITTRVKDADWHFVHFVREL